MSDSQEVVTVCIKTFHKPQREKRMTRAAAAVFIPMYRSITTGAVRNRAWIKEDADASASVVKDEA